MPKEMIVDPEKLSQRGELKFASIKLHDYSKSFEEERARHGDNALKDVLRHMLIIREFESMLGSFKATGAYQGIPFIYRGPAHLSIGQEGAAVGAALGLEPEDHIFGSHRSHGEFLAKGLASIQKLDEHAVNAMMADHQDGALHDTVQRFIGGTGKSLAENFLLFGLLAEIFMRSNGFNGGMGGSMHAFFPPVGAYPNNAIVGASAGIATGAALRKKLNGETGICVANAGDGSTGCGPVWEAMNFASMAQFTTLWDETKRGGLPVLFFLTIISTQWEVRPLARPWHGIAFRGLEQRSMQTQCMPRP
uniref:thiamine pyrophosphate-dependent enzyme n=1 Tax=Rhizobium sp. RCAM05350 TaxID=2895568 RepID=UPI002076A1BB|nr:thiamine pyrophosphate-dependent enzyme [Rhizobium sp. RCAM05350]